MWSTDSSRGVCIVRYVNSFLLVLCLAGLWAPTAVLAQNIAVIPQINTVAGGGTAGYSGNGGPASSSQLNLPFGVAVDSAGNLYIADENNSVVRKVDTNGIIATVAGNGTVGFSGDSGPATSAALAYPCAVAVDQAGNLYIADQNNYRIRKVSTSGTITTVAGNGTPGYSGDNGLATSAQISVPFGVAVDSGGNLYIADDENNRIRKVDSTGTITTVAGNGTAGFSGDGGLATNAQIYNPAGVSVDGAGNLYISDSGNNRIRKVDTSGTITTIAGNGTRGYSGDGGPATSAELNQPWGLVIDGAGTVYISDFANYRIRSVTASGTITTIAGNGIRGYSGDGGPASSSEFGATGLALSRNANLIIADTINSRVRQVSSGLDFGQVNVGQSSTHAVILQATTSSAVTNLNAGGDYFVNSAAQTNPACVHMLSPGTICTETVIFTPSKPGQRWFALQGTDGSGNTYSLGLTGIGLGPAVAFTPGVISTVAGVFSFPPGPGGYSGDGGPATSAQLSNPMAVTVDSAGNIYIADQMNGRVRKVSLSGIITTVAGGGTGCPAQTNTFGDGCPATSAQLIAPQGVAVDSAGDLYVADASGERIRMVGSNGIITTVAGNGTQGFSGDGGPATAAQFYEPSGIALDSTGNLYIAEVGNNRIRRVDTNGIITTVAGNGIQGYSGDGGAATSAALFNPWSITVDAAGNLYIADRVNSRIRKVDTNGIITTVAGNGVQGYSGDGGAATSAELGFPPGVEVDSAGNLYIADGSLRVRKVDTSGIITTVAGNGSFGYAGDGGAAISAQLSELFGIALDNSGNFYIADSMNNAIRKIDVTITPTLAFGNLDLGFTSATQTVIISNVGTAALNLSSIALTANFENVAIGNDCALGALAQGASCNVGIAFVAGSTGNFTGTATVTDTAYNSPQSISLSGTGVQVPSSLAFTPPPPSNLPAGIASLTIGVSVLDLNSNLVTGSTTNVTVTITGPGSFSNSQSAAASSGVATFTFSNLQMTTAGTYTLTATSSSLTSATSTLTVQESTATSLASGSNPSLSGVPVTFTVIVTPAFSGIPTGSVIFKDGATIIGTGTLNASGVATFTTLSLPPGQHSITAAYGGDTNDAASTSAPLTQTVQQNTTTALSALPNPALPGSTVTLTVTVTASVSGTPTGTVTFKDGTTTLGTVTLNASAVATFSTTTLAVASHSITAVYSGDSINLASTSSVVNEIVQENISISLASSMNPVLTGTALTFTTTVTGSAPSTPTGTITFKDGAAILGSAPLNASGIATFSSPAFSPGQHSITAVYSGDALNLPATSGVFTETVQQNTSTTLVSSANSSFSGASVTFTAAVTTSVSGTPTGTVTFKDEGATLGTGQLNASGFATYAASALSVASHTITAVYSGDALNLTSTSAPFTQTVNAANFMLAANPASQTITDGQTATYSLTVTPQGSFTSPINFSCSGLPLLANCTFSSPSLTPGANTATTTLTITTVGNLAMSTRPSPITPRNRLVYIFGACASLLTLVSLFFVWGDVKHTWGLSGLRRAAALAGFLFIVIGSMVACAGGSKPSTPVGTDQLQITASSTTSSGNVSHSTAITLTIQ